ncbi:DNA methyltransferase [Brevundimonas naejangsanensis]|uniref:DNA methyltransferase n=1 Tax=Brevundimonas naejangsanensis TaxID=588932 RepID=UPI003D001072
MVQRRLVEHGVREHVWDYASVNSGGSRAAELDWHPTVKPVAMVSDAIKDVTKRGQLVLDAFLGSGTTLIAAERAGLQRQARSAGGWRRP